MANKITVNDLSLELAARDTPFALVKTEQYFGPDDWAWQFLRLNHSYRRDYADALHDYSPDEESPEGEFWVTDNYPHRTIRVAEQHCRQRYGLSTWLDPRSSRLPALGKGESWFYPLMHVVDSPEKRSGVVPMEDVFSYCYPSGAAHYDARRALLKAPGLGNEPSSAIWFAIDCSIPPDAQLKSVEVLSKAHREWFVEKKQKTPSSSLCDSLPIPLHECLHFHSEKFEAASALVGKSAARLAWYAIRIETRGPIKGQVEKYLTTLGTVHRDLCKSEIVEPAFRERFRSELPGPRDENGVLLSDGHFLKALAICAQLSQLGLSETEVVDFLAAHASYDGRTTPKQRSARDNWDTGLSERAAKYREHARLFVKGGYRWLVQAQKP